MGLLNELESFGVDVDSAVARLGGDEEIYEEILIDFPEDSKNYEILPCFEEGDYDMACQNAHALKGAAGNLGLDPLYEMYKSVNDLLKDGKNDEARAIYDEGYALEKEIMDCIKKYADEY